jgi:putative ATPase
MDLFDKNLQENLKTEAPLADRMRPESLEEFSGQEEILKEGKLLRSIIQSDKLTSIIFWGPPGTGKTTLAYIIAKNTKCHFSQFSAVTAGVADLRKVVSEAKERRKFKNQKTILFVDEIHRFNKAQQDAFLPYIENGTIILIGATTENPGFEINSPLLSRSRLFRLEPLSASNLKIIIKRALTERQRGLGDLNLKIDPKAEEHIINFANGDARVALNALEIASSGLKKGEKITLKIAEQAISKKSLLYDRAGDQHYDTISAFIKSMRGSDPDATVYYLARMLQSGEDPKFIARRMVIFASEDIGNADPIALVLASSCAQAVQFVGMPEAQLNLSQTALYLACASKSNSVKEAINKANSDIQNKRQDPIPPHLRNTPTKLAKSLGYGKISTSGV